MKRKIQDLSPQEVLALAISIEETNQKALLNYANQFKSYDKEVSDNFMELSIEECYHKELLLAQYEKSFESPFPEISPSDMEEIVEALDIEGTEDMVIDTMKSNRVFRLAYEAEVRAGHFYQNAMNSAKDPELAALFKKLSLMEGDHAGWLEDKIDKK